jgi:hypothetical protein
MTDQQIINLFFEELIEEICKEENSSSFDYIDDKTKAWVIERRMRYLIRAIIRDYKDKLDVPW